MEKKNLCKHISIFLFLQFLVLFNKPQPIVEPKDNNQVVIIFSFLTLTLFNHATQAISVASNSHPISSSSAPSPQQPPVPPSQTHISAPTTSANPPKTDICAPTPSENPPKNDISAPTPSANPPKNNISAATPSENPPKNDVSAPTPTANPPKADISTPTQAPDPSQGILKIPLPDPSPSKSPLPPNSEIKHICDLTDFPALCWPYIGSFYSGKSDASSVLEMAINATVQQINLAHSAIAQLATSDHPNLASKTPPTLLDDCKEMYDDALENLKSAMDGIPEHDTRTINIMLSAALTDRTTCDDEFTGKNSPVGDINSKLSKLLSNCLAIASLIKK